MLSKIRIFIFWVFYSWFFLFIGELILIKYFKMHIEMFFNNSKFSKQPASFIIFKIIILSILHVTVIALNITAFYLTAKNF